MPYNEAIDARIKKILSRWKSTQAKKICETAAAEIDISRIK